MTAAPFDMVRGFNPWFLAPAAGLTAAAGMPGLAFAQDAQAAAMRGEGLIAAGIIAVISLGLLAWLRGRLRKSQAEAEFYKAETGRLEAFLSAAPTPFCAFSQGGATGASRSFRELFEAEAITGISDICDLLPDDQGEQLGAEFARLRTAGTPFDLAVATKEGKTIRLSGRRGAGEQAASQFDLLWAEDITDRITANAGLQEQVERLQRHSKILSGILDRLPMPLWYRAAGDRITMANAAYANALEMPIEKVLEGSVELGGAVISQGGTALATRARASQQNQSESHHLVIGGDRRHITFHECPTADGSIVGYALDDTPLDEANSQLQRHITAHASVLELMPSAIAIFDGEKRLIFFNQAYVSLFGFEERMLEGQPLMGDLLEDMRERRRLPETANFPDFKRGQLDLFTTLIDQQEQLLHLPDGMTLRSIVTAHPFGGLLFLYEDVTSALALESNVKVLIEVQRESLDNLAEGIAVFASDGRLRLSNPAFAKIWNLSAEDLKGLPHVAEVIDRTRALYTEGQDMSDEDWQEKRDEMVARALERTGFEEVIERSDGSVVEHISVPLPDGNVLKSYLDVSDTARVEQALRSSNEALETADRLKSEFIANVSYQLRTPLNAITGFAEILDNEYFGELNERQKEYTANIVDASQRLLALINDILDLATIEAGYMTLEPKPLESREILESVYRLTSDWASKQSLTVKIDAPDKIGHIIGDDRRLRQALYNLVSNSIKFTPPNGTITLTGCCRDDQVRLTVTDTGVGIPEDDRQRVLGKFEKAQDASGNRGAGLGLALVKSLVELHGGKVLLESEVGKGTAVTCVLPLAHDGAPILLDGAAALLPEGDSGLPPTHH